MYYLYGSKPGKPARLVATFDTEEQLRAYVRWATLSVKEGARQFEKGSTLVNYQEASYTQEPLTDDDPTRVDHNPTPSML